MINKNNFVMIAMKAYDNPSCKTLVEFEEDLSKFSNLVRLCSKDMNEAETNTLLNAVMTLLNIFEASECIRMMFFKAKREDWYKLKTVLVFLNRMPNEIPDLELKDSEIPLCQSMITTLRKI